jgi:putative ABC transport system permease protein
MAPRWLRPVRRLFARFVWRVRDGDMEREMAFHVDELSRELMRGGMDAAAARAAARRRFGDTTRMKERGHDVRGSAAVDGLFRDLRHMGRALVKSPGFSAAVVLTLAVGIGANTAIFSVVDQLLLRPLPYPGGDRLVMVHETFQDSPNVLTNSVSPANWLDWQRESRTIVAFAAWRTTTYTLTGIGEPTRVNAQVVSAEFFPLLGVQPLLGRTIDADDDRPNAPQAAVLSHAFWQRHFAADRLVVGRAVQLSDRPFQIVGVMPPGFRFVHPETDLWAATRLDRAQRWRETAGRFINVVGRLAPGPTLGEARAEMRTIASRLSAQYEFNRRTGVALTPLRETLTGQVAGSLVLLYCAVAVLLAIACFNVANLLVARAASRRREIAIRSSLGAGRLALVQQQLVESVLLAAAGGILGMLIARLSLDALVAFAPADLLGVPELLIDRRVLGYAVGLSVLTGVVVGLVPAVLVAGQPVAATLRAGGRGLSQAPRIRQLLVICQVSMTVVLLCGAGLLARTMVALEATDNGLDKRDLLTMEVALPSARYDGARRVVFFQEAVQSLRALPGVAAAAAGDSLPIVGGPRGGTIFHVLGTPEKTMSESPIATIRVATPGFFRTLGIPVLRGREFAPADDTTAQPGFVVNESFVRAHLAGVDPLTVSLKVWMLRDNPYMPILGVVGDVSERSVRTPAEPTIFYSHAVMNETAMSLFVRGDRAESLARAAVAAVHAIDPNLAVTKVRTFEGALGESLARERLSALVTGSFAASALLLSALGLYGLLAFLVTEQTKEIGIRIALGAGLAALTRSVLAGGLRLVLVGAIIGVAGSLVLLRSLGALLFGVTPYDPSTYAAVLALLFGTAALASYLPARRAARVQPLDALRQD